ncbi:MAG: UvrD-helicase domain-containing protein [Nocardioides sp.]
MTEPLTDQADRDRIAGATDTTLFVNAGAGSGKTKSLVDRVVTLVIRDQIPMSSIAAVTFTEKAGAELRDRLRAEFEKRWRSGDDTLKPLAQAALDDLDSAAIGTLHSFAQRVLMEHPIEAGLPPVIELLDEVGSSVAFDDRWNQLQVDLLDDDAIAEPLLLGLAVGVKIDHLRSLAHLLGNDWDLIRSRILDQPRPELRVPDLDGFLDRVVEVANLRGLCTLETDKLLPKLEHLNQLGVLMAGAPDTASQLRLLAQIADMKFSNIGNKNNWTVDVNEVRDAGTELVASAASVVRVVLDQCLRLLTTWTAEKVWAAAADRQRAGQLEFHDLLVLARDLLRKDPAVRAALHQRYQRLLLDEFQDTDPIQIELAVRIAGGAAAEQDDWRDVVVPEGRLFVVGDAKQSIYRFRRASIATYLEAESLIGEDAHLTTNFRTVAPILDWVNGVFGELIEFQADGQPAYEALGAYRHETGTGAAVTVLGGSAHTDLPRAAAEILRTREANDVAAAIRRAIDEQWQVFDEKAGEWRPARHSDIAVLIPARTSLPRLEDALDTAGVPYRAEASSLVYQAGEVRDLLACARAIADPSDQLSLVTALRSAVFGCGDDDLWHWKQAGGNFNLYADAPSDDPRLAPVGAALTYLAKLANQARWLTPSEVLGRIIADRRMLETASYGPRVRDSWRRLRFVVDQARAWSETARGGLRGYLAWAAHQGQETSRVAESVLPETDVDAVRVMTVHAAKGLEFPIVILSGMTSQTRRGSGVRILWTKDGYSVSLSRTLETDDFNDLIPVDEQMDTLEKLRLLYVAATRARDHLVVSLHRPEKPNGSAASLFAGAGGDNIGSPDHFEAGELGETIPAPGPAISELPDYERWLAQLTRIREQSRATTVTSASGLEGTEPEIVLGEADEVAQGRAKGPRDLELPPWSKGRYGSAIGRAVHAVLQVVDLQSSAGLESAVTAQALAEGVDSQVDLVRALVRSALGSNLVRRAAIREHWRETYVGTVLDDGTLLEGYVDLVYREDDGSLVVVDYKTDAVPADALDSRITYYRPQMDAYIRCLTAATGGDVSAQLLFLHPETSVAAPIS